MIGVEDRAESRAILEISDDAAIFGIRRVTQDHRTERLPARRSSAERSRHAARAIEQEPDLGHDRRELDLPFDAGRSAIGCGHARVEVRVDRP